MRSTKEVLNHRSPKGRFYLYISASLNGIGIAALGVVLELFIKVGSYFDFMETSLEGFINPADK